MGSQSARSAVRLGAVATLLGAAAFSWPGPTAPGITYTITARSGKSGPLAAMLASMGQADTMKGWTGVVVWAKGRGRMDLTAGGQFGMFQQGDYVLFDSTDYIVVRPSAATFFTMPAYANTAAFAEQASTPPPGVSMTLSDVKVTLDTVGRDALAGVPGMHYRIASTFTMNIRMGGLTSSLEAAQQMTTKSTYDYWFGDAPPVPRNPLVNVGAIATAGPQPVPALFKELADQQTAAHAGLPSNKVLLRSATSTESTGMGMTNVSGDTISVSAAQRVDVDVDKLVLPDGYKAAQVQALAAMYQPGDTLQAHAAKWRVKP